MRGARILAAAMAAALIAGGTAGCGQRHAPAPGAGSPAPAPSGSDTGTAAAAGCNAGPLVPSGRILALGNGDAGKTLCVRPGAMVLLILRGGPGRTWAPVRASSGVLTPRPNGRLMLARWATGASFAAVRPGTAVLTSELRVSCRGVPASTRSARPAAVLCDAVLSFRVTVVVRAG